MKTFLLVKIGENFGNLYKLGDENLSFVALERVTANFHFKKLYRLDHAAIKVIFEDQMPKLKTWQEHNFKDCCTVFLPRDFDRLLGKTDHWWSKYYKQIPDAETIDDTSSK